jgi:hypothetical protein
MQHLEESIPLTPAMRLELDELRKKMDQEFERCVRSGQFLIAVVTTEEEKIHLEGLTHEFPIDQFPSALELLREKFDEERRRIESVQDER